MSNLKNRLIYYLLIIAFTMVNCGQSSERTTSHVSNVKAENIEANKSYLKVQPVYNFGEIDKNKVPVVNFRLDVINLGDAPLVILKADVACGCMNVEYTKHPIKTGEKGVLNVRINTANQIGVFNKSIIIKSNSQNDVVAVRVKGHVL